MKIWTRAYRPFMMGGDANTPVATEMRVLQGPFDLGKGMTGYLVTATAGKHKGETFVVEGAGGGIVGKTLEDVRRDVQEADEEVMKEQAAWSVKECARADVLENDDFWGMVR